ncbi:MAG: 50S ribosomal protein L20 [Sedimentisphaerales bacterium]|nr:50S ribosomal protein L20 [Sedimentisphaerales bacterium]
MPRVRKGSARTQSKKRILKRVKGHANAPGRAYRLAKEASVKAQVNAKIGRKQRKRQFRSLWIVRLNAACKERQIRYSEFINGCKKANIELNRKMLSEIAIADASAFDVIVEKVKAALQNG